MAKIEVLTQKNDFQILRLRQVHMLVASLVKLQYLHIPCNEKIWLHPCDRSVYNPRNSFAFVVGHSDANAALLSQRGTKFSGPINLSNTFE